LNSFVVNATPLAFGVATSAFVFGSDPNLEASNTGITCDDEITPSCPSNLSIPSPIIMSFSESGGATFQFTYIGDVDVSSEITTPLPSTWSMMLIGLGALGLFGWRRKRKAQAVAT
jgi:PEP-CTERM motif